MRRLVEVLSSGGGTQSTAICALIVDGILPKPDYIVIADTGYEIPTTWQYLDEVVRPALKSVGCDIHRIPREGYVSDITDGVFYKKSGVLIPAYTNRNGRTSKLSNFCTTEWKVSTVQRFLSRNHGVTRSKYRKWIGFSLDESRRVERMKASKDYKKGLVYFPLVDLQLRREDSLNIVREIGWPEPPRSRCFICPHQNDMEWSEVESNHQGKWHETIALDDHIRETDPNAFLHSSFKPLKDAVLKTQDEVFSGSCPSGECFT